MTLHRNGFEGQTNGVAVTTANSAASGAAFTSVVEWHRGGHLQQRPPWRRVDGDRIAPEPRGNCYVEDASFSTTALADEFVFWYSGTGPGAATGPCKTSSARHPVSMSVST